MKLKLKTKKRIQGSISIFLVIILVPTMLLSGLLVDLSRFSMAKAMISSAGDLTMNAALADYDAILKEVYGLFAISQEDADLYKNLNEYFKTTLVSNGVVSEADSKNYVDTLLGNLGQYLYVDKNSGEVNMNDVSNLFDMQISAEAAVKGAEGSTLANPTILKKQIVEYMKYRAPINIGLSFFSSLNSISKSGQQAEVVQSKITAEEKTTDVQSAAKTLYDHLIEYDNQLYETNTINVGSKDTQKATEGDEAENDTDGFASYVNTEIYRNETRYNNIPRLAEDGNYWDYQTVNRYVLTFLMDEKVDKITFDTDKPDDAESKLHEKTWQNGEDVNKNDIETALKEAADELDEKNEKLKNYGALHSTYSALADEYYTVGAGLDTVKTYDYAMPMYKTLRGKLSETKVNTDQLKEDYSSYLQAAANMEATYSDATKYLKLVIDDKDKASDKEAEEMQKKIDEIKKVFDDFLEDRQGGEGNENAYDGLEKPDDKGELSEDCELGKSAEQKEAEETISWYKDAYNTYNQCCIFAKQYVDDMTNDIQEEAQYIYQKTIALEKLLNTIITDTNTLLQKVSAYNSALDSWETQNDTYEANANGGSTDEFSANNGQEIEENRERYNAESIEKVRTYAQEQLAKIYPFKSYLEGDGWRYGNRKLNNIGSADEAVSAAGAQSAAFKNKESVTSAECDAALQSLCPESSCKYNYGETRTALYSFLKKSHINPSSGEDTTVLEFVGYLKCTFTETEQYRKSEKVTDEKTGEQENAKSLYESLKNNVNEGDTVNSGKSESDPDYGYSYYDKQTPSSDASSPSSTAKANADDAAESYKKQKDGSASILSNIANALENCRDDIFVMEYIMSDFSYNTIVQDAAYKNSDQKGMTFYTTANSETYSKYKALTAEEKAKYANGKEKDPDEATRPATLSGYPISSYNNEYYGAEVEYLLYGMQSADNNVTMAYTSIYGLRFILNSVYAFTNTEIRNMARTAGLSVQAATLGTVPYQAVMVVIQLALSMSESLLDLDVMKTGAKVAVVPTKDTWMLSPTGASKLLKTAVKSKIQDTADGAITAAVDNARNGLQNFVDASADEIDQKAGEMIENLNSIASSKADEMLDQSFGEVEGTLLAELDKLPYIDYTQAGNSAEAAVNSAFDTARAKKEEVIANLQSGNGSEVGKTIANLVNEQIDNILEEMRAESRTKLSEYMAQVQADDPNKAAAEFITSYIYEIESGISEKIQKQIDSISSAARKLAEQTVTETATAINSVVGEKSEEAKQKAITAVNKFIDEKVDTVADKISDVSNLASTGQSFDGSSSVSHSISFGYSDYLRTFLFIGLATNDNQILIRTADLIERNINYPNTALSEEKEKADSFFGELFKKISWFFGASDDKKTVDKKWHMSKAYTYVQIDADIDMDMFFMKTSLFNNWMNAGMAEIGADELDTTNTKSTYHYHSVMGY